jgi:hypothetical protein
MIQAPDAVLRQMYMQINQPRKCNAVSEIFTASLVLPIGLDGLDLAIFHADYVIRQKICL